MPDQIKTFMVEDAKIIFRNFAGKEAQYNREGDRNFSVILDESTAADLLANNWNVKALKAREEGDPEVPYITVSVSYKNRPPQVIMITSTARTHLGEDTIEVLDWAEFRTVDLICNGYEWDVNGKQGVKAYLKSLYVTIEEDALARKYAINSPEA